MTALVPVVRPADDPHPTDRLPAVCFRFPGVRGGMVMFAADPALPPYPYWHAFWPATMGKSAVTSVRVARWSEWVRWAVTLPPVVDAPVATPPGRRSPRDRRFYDFLAAALGPTPTVSQQRLLHQAAGRRWVVAPFGALAAATGMSPGQVRAAARNLVTAGVAERLVRFGTGAAWGIRLVTLDD